MNKKLNVFDPHNPDRIRTDSRDNRYITYPNGQVRRLSPEGTPLPRIKMSKKERLRLRREYRKIESLESSELAKKILSTPVINPPKKDSASTESGQEKEGA